MSDIIWKQRLSQKQEGYKRGAGGGQGAVRLSVCLCVFVAQRQKEEDTFVYVSMRHMFPTRLCDVHHEISLMDVVTVVLSCWQSQSLLRARHAERQRQHATGCTEDKQQCSVIFVDLTVLRTPVIITIHAHTRITLNLSLIYCMWSSMERSHSEDILKKIYETAKK